MTTTPWLRALELEGPALLTILTVVFAIAVIGLWSCRRRPDRQRRFGSLVLASATVWVICAMLPLPRSTREGGRTEDSVTKGAPERHASVSEAGANIGAHGPWLLATGQRQDEPERQAAMAEGDVQATAREPVEPASSRSETRLFVPENDRVPSIDERPIERAKAILTSPSTARVQGERWLAGSLAFAYLIGAASTFLVIVLAWVAWLRCVRTSQSAPAWMVKLVRERIGSRARVVLHGRLPRPLVGGLRRPWILLPEHLADEEQAGVARSVLLHECGHVEHGDLRERWLHALACILFWFHPLFWVVRARVRFASELLADAYVTRTTKTTEYAREILTLAERRQRMTLGGLFFPTLFTRRSELYRRITMLLRTETRLPSRSTRGARMARLACILVLGVGTSAFFGVREVRAQDPAEAMRLKDQVHQLLAEREHMQTRIDELSAVIARLESLVAKSQAREINEARVRAEGRREALLRMLQGAQDPETKFESAVDRETLIAQTQRGLAQVEDEIAALRRAETSEPARTVAWPGVAEQTEAAARQAKSSRQGRLDAPSHPGSTPSVTAQDVVSVQHPEPMASAAGEPRDAYVLDLVYRTLDLMAEIETLETRMEQTEKLVKNGMVSASEFRATAIAHRTLQRKLEAVRTLVQVERATTESEIKATKDRLEAFSERIDPSVRLSHYHALLRLEGRLTILQQVK